MVTALGFGAMDLGGPPMAQAVTDDEAEAVLNAVLDGGINFIDSAGCYGVSEERIGRFISKRRDEYVLATKCGCVGNSTGSPHVHTAAAIRTGVENSLRSMKTDYIDVMQFHQSITPAEWESAGALDELLKIKQEGKIGFIGISGSLPNITAQITSGVFDTFQIPYSALQREHEDVIAAASATGAGIIIRGGVARGTPTDWKKTYYMLPSDELNDRWTTAGLDELLDGMSRIEFTLRFTLSDPALDTTIVGTKRAAHLQQNIDAALKGPLPRTSSPKPSAV